MNAPRRAPAAVETGFPLVERFLEHEIEARALGFALDRGLIDRLARGPSR
ncbi:hypothetical protein [Methylobacterium durans]|nr:hypothetical protein [Methylobacterium durans]